jgi:hypothetical protein
LDGYVDYIVEREFEELGRKLRRPATLRRWMAAYAAATATTASFEKIRDAATSDEVEKPSRATALAYRDILVRLWVLDPLPPWLPTRNQLRQLASPSKHHLVDPALAARLLGVDADALLRAAPASPNVRRDRRVAIEVKLGAVVADRDVRQLLWLREKLGDELADTVVVSTGREAYRRKDGIAVVPLALLGP